MSEKTLFQKMFIKAGMKFTAISIPSELESIYQNNLTDVQFFREPVVDLDIIQVYVMNENELRSRLVELKPYLKPVTGVIWISYPKGTSPVPTDINRDSIWKIAREYGLTVNNQVAVDETWSALRFKNIPL